MIVEHDQISFIFQHTKLSECRQQLVPLEEQKDKLSTRINELNTMLRSREKKLEHLSKEKLELKSAKQLLEEENAHQCKSLQTHLSQSSAHRVEKDKLLTKNKKLSQANTVSHCPTVMLVQVLHSFFSEFKRPS